MSRTHFTPTLFSVYFSASVIGYEERGVKTANGKNQKEQFRLVMSLSFDDRLRGKLRQALTYNFNGIDYALVRNEVVNRKPAM
jgi:hypothetical protein